MADENQNYQRDPRITFESVLLLVIFISAALFVAALAYKMAPWEGDNGDPAAPTVAGNQDTGEAAAAGEDELTEGAEETAQ